MKTSLKTLLAAVMTAVVLSSTVLTSMATVKSGALRTLPAKHEIKKVIVRGNTKVFFVQSNTEYVEMEESNVDKVSVKQVGNELLISSSEKSPVVVTVYVKDIFRVDASNDAVIKTVGKLNVKFLQVILKDHAIAKIKTNTESLYTVINDHASLELLGATNKLILKTDGFAKLNTEKFAAVITSNVPADNNAIAMNTNAQ